MIPLAVPNPVPSASPLRQLFRAVKERPEDDAPRLVLADWLQENGDTATADRGEFLRLGVLRARLPADDPQHERLKRRQAELFSEHRWRWLGPLRDAARRWTLERGLVQVWAHARRIVSHEIAGWAHSEAALWVDALALPEGDARGIAEWRNETSAFLHLVGSPLLSQVNRLDLSGHTHPVGLELVFRALRLGNLPFLRQLVLPGNHLTIKHVYSLSRCPAFARLSYLDLRYNRLDDAAAGVLVASPYLKDNTVLRLGNNRFTDGGTALLREAFGERACF